MSQICEDLTLTLKVPLTRNVKTVERGSRMENSRRSAPFKRNNGAKIPSLEELMNKHQEESARRSAKMKEWFKKLQENTEINTRSKGDSLKKPRTPSDKLTKISI
ncbi:hypothetical protein Tco_1343619 [Tanacetum coccineum]